MNGSVYHYRDASGLECDAIIHLRNGSYGLIEIKLGGESQIEEGIDNLKKLCNKIDTSKMKNPSFMMVLTATGKYAYKREDGVCPYWLFKKLAYFSEYHFVLEYPALLKFM